MGKKSNSPKKASPPKKAKSTVNKGKGGGSAGGGDKAPDRILKAIAGRAAFKEEKPDRKMIMGLAAMANEKSFGTTILNMKNKGLVEYDRTTIWLTDKGKEEVGEDALTVPQTNDAMQATLREQVTGQKPRLIFDILLDGRAYGRAELAEMLKLEDNKSFGTYVSALSKVSERVEGKKIRLKDIAFPCGRPSE